MPGRSSEMSGQRRHAVLLDGLRSQKKRAMPNAFTHQVRNPSIPCSTREAGGKNPDRILYALDAGGGTLDPAFDAHVGPVKSWAFASWEGWFTREQLDVAFAEASLKLARCKGSWWSAVVGPTTALVATLARIGWTMP